MKKFILISMIAVAAMGMIGCGEDDKTKADLRWGNDSGDNIQNIKWLKADRSEDQSWDGTLADTNYSSFKGISSLNGYADCLDKDGDPANVTLATTGSTGLTSSGFSSIGGDSATIQEDAAAVLVIDVVAKK